MNRLEQRLAEIKASGEKALIPFLTAGDPCLASTEALMNVLVENGADVIELGLPFSDPLADGPVLQAAADRALAAGTTPDGVFSLVSRFTEKHDTPVVLLVYYNMVLRRGVERFCREAAQAGVCALVVPDLPYEEAGRLDMAAVAQGLINIRFIAPTTTESRLARLSKSAAGFVYCVAVTGVTGERAAIDPALLTLLERTRALTDVPLALGFGIANPRQAAEAAAAADAVIVGSALVARIEKAQSLEEKCGVAGTFIRSLKDAIRGGAKDAG